MEANQLPTKPGPYYWRESEGGEWEIAQINRCMDVYFAGCDMHYGLKETGGQWLPIPTAEELVELQAKAKAYDEGQEMMQLAYDANKMSLLVTPDNKEVVDIYTKATGYTCEPVTIVRKAKR